MQNPEAFSPPTRILCDGPKLALEHIIMGSTFYYGTANDNDAQEKFPRGDAVGFRSLLLDKQREYTAMHSTSIVKDLTDEVKSSHISLALALVCWLAATVSLLWCFYTGQSIGLRLFSAMATIWTALWTAYLAQDQYKPRLAELTVLSALIGFVCMLLTASTQLGLPLETPGGMAMFSAATLVVAFLTHSRIALMCSITACLCWAALYLDGYIAPSLAILALPALWSGHVLLAARMKSNISIFAATIVAYAWVGGYGYTQYLAGNLSPIFLVTGTFMVASVHYRAAKAAEDEGFGGMALHILFSWCLAFAAMLAIQNAFLHPQNEPWNKGVETAALMQAGFLALVAGALGIIALAGLVRRRHGQMTLFAVISQTLIYGAIPAAIWFKPLVSEQFATHTGLPASPGIGLFVAGIMFASAFVFSLNNVRRNRILLSLFGFIAIALEADAVLKNEFLNLDYMSILLSGLILCMCVIFLQARAQFDPAAPQRNLRSLRGKHA